jgi:hypothetical protein
LVHDEFTKGDTDATLDTMVTDAYVNHIPVLTGGVGREELKVFYSKHFIPKMPPDTEMVPISRTISTDRLVDEMIFRFSQSKWIGAARCCPDRQAGGMRTGRNRPLSERESSPTSIYTGIKLLC